ncbi:MAG: transposase domain-containing protein [Lachnospiraceae bacterium]|nr:transposase domain-containing protein [Lachnospiraceae bacterium]
MKNSRILLTLSYKVLPIVIIEAFVTIPLAKLYLSYSKANHLRVYDYFEYILTELASHQDDTSREFLADLMPWSEKAQEKCGHPKKS